MYYSMQRSLFSGFGLDADIIKTALDRVQERYANVQQGLLESWQDWQRLTAEQQAKLRALKYFDRLELLTQSVQNLLSQYNSAVQLLASGSLIDANSAADALEPLVSNAQDEMDKLNQLQATVTGRLIQTAIKREPTASLLERAVTWGLVIAGLYVGGRLLVAYSSKKSQRYPSPPNYARR